MLKGIIKQLDIKLSSDDKIDSEYEYYYSLVYIYKKKLSRTVKSDAFVLFLATELGIGIDRMKQIYYYKKDQPNRRDASGKQLQKIANILSVNIDKLFAENL